MNIHSVYLLFQKYFRKKRMEQFVRIFNVNNNTRILDIGGTPLNWLFISKKPRISMLNVDIPPNFRQLPENLSYVKGNGLNLPYKNNFDIAYSNSVIEHLYTFENQKKFAQEISRISRNIYVQTPNRHFFVEPHLITPFIHYLPKRLQRHLLRNFTIWGIITGPPREEINRFLKEVRLLTYSELRILFPDCNIIKERFCFLTKSFIIIRKSEKDITFLKE